MLTSLWASCQRSSGAVEKVENGTTTAPIRVAASMATTKSTPLGYSRPTWVPLPAPRAMSPRASRAER